MGLQGLSVVLAFLLLLIALPVSAAPWVSLKTCGGVLFDPSFSDSLIVPALGLSIGYRF